MILKFKNLIRLIQKMGGFQVEAITLEQELTDLGFEIEKRRINSLSLHSADLPTRLLNARKWALASGFSETSYNFLLQTGAHFARGGK